MRKRTGLLFGAGLVFVALLSACSPRSVPPTPLPPTEPPTYAAQPTGTPTPLPPTEPPPYVPQPTKIPAPTETPVPPTPTAEPLTDRPGHVWIESLGVEADYAYRSFLQIPVGVAWGPDGYLYVADWTGRHVVRVAKDGSMDDLGLWRTVTAIQQEGPRGVAFDSQGNLYISTNHHIFRLNTSGDLEELAAIVGSLRGNIGNIALNASDELYYTRRGDNVLLKWNPSGDPEIIASDIPDAENIVFGLDGTLYLNPMGSGAVLKVDVSTGEVIDFLNGDCGPDACFLAVDPEGDLWVRGLGYLHQFTPEGVEKPWVIDGEPSPGEIYGLPTSAGIAFDDEGGLWVASYNSKLVRLIPTTAGASDPEFTMTLISPGLDGPDLAMDSNGAIYAADQNVGDLNVGRVLRITPNHEVELVCQHGARGRVAVAVDDEGVVYLGMPHGEIVLVEEDGSLTHYAAVKARRMVFAANGILYAVAEDQGQSIVSITGTDTVTTLATEIGGISLGDGLAHISPALGQGLYVFTEREANLFFVDFEGQGHLIVNLQALGSGGPALMAASPTSGDVYLISHGPYSLFRIDAEGHHEEIASHIFGDPCGMVVSQDGKYLFIAEAGAIDVIPLAP